MTYREHIYKVLTQTDLDDRDDVVDTMKYLAKEVIQFNALSLAQEAKLKELMTAKDFEEWSVKESKNLFRITIEMSEDEDFKEFCIDNFDSITGGSDA